MACATCPQEGEAIMPDALAPSWQVTQQSETSDIGPEGTYVAGVKVTFRTARGVVGSVFVPSKDYTIDTVQRMVSERAAVVDAVAGLAG
jgi:hypothetical protein